MPYYAHLTDEEFLRQAEATQDPLYTTDLERELMRRLATFIDGEAELDPLNQVLDHSHVALSDLAGLVRVLDKHDATDSEELDRRLERAAKFRDLAEEAGDLFDRLNQLVNTTV